jgi:hypothetical protein
LNPCSAILLSEQSVEGDSTLTKRDIKPWPL